MKFVYHADCFFDENMLSYRCREGEVIPVTQVLAPLHKQQGESPGTEKQCNA